MNSQPQQYHTDERSSQGLLFQSKKTPKTQCLSCCTGTNLREQRRSKYHVCHESVLILPPKLCAPICRLPSTSSNPLWWDAPSPGTFFKMPGFSSLPAEQSSSCGPTHNVVTGWEAGSSAGEGSSPTETSAFHTWSKRIVIQNWLLHKTQQCTRVTATRSLKYVNKNSFPFLTGNSTVWDNKTERAAALKIQPAQNKL